MERAPCPKHAVRDSDCRAAGVVETELVCAVKVLRFILLVRYLCVFLLSVLSYYLLSAMNSKVACPFRDY